MSRKRQSSTASKAHRHTGDEEDDGVRYTPRGLQYVADTQPPPHEVFRILLTKMRDALRDVRTNPIRPEDARAGLVQEAARHVLLVTQEDGMAAKPAVRLPHELMTSEEIEQFPGGMPIVIPVYYKCALPKCMNTEDPDTAFAKCRQSGMYYCSAACRARHASTPEFMAIVMARKQRMAEAAVMDDVSKGKGVQRVFRLTAVAEFHDCMAQYERFRQTKAAARSGETVIIRDWTGRTLDEDEYHRSLFGIGLTDIQAISGDTQDRLDGDVFANVVRAAGVRREEMMRQYDVMRDKYNALAQEINEAKAGSAPDTLRLPTHTATMEEEGLDMEEPIPAGDDTGGLYEKEREAYACTIALKRMQAAWNRMQAHEKEHEELRARVGAVPPTDVVGGPGALYTQRRLERILAAYGVNLAEPTIATGGKYRYHELTVRCAFNTHAIVMAATTTTPPPGIDRVTSHAERSSMVAEHHNRKLAFLLRDIANSPIIQDVLNELELLQTVERCVIVSNPDYGVLLATPCGSSIYIGNREQRKLLGEENVDESVDALVAVARKMRLAD